MKRFLAITAAAAICVLAALAAFSGSARATYPGATNGRIAFGMNVNGNVDVYTALPGGQDLRRLTTDAGFDACAAYSADGQRIAYPMAPASTRSRAAPPTTAPPGRPRAVGSPPSISPAAPSTRSTPRTAATPRRSTPARASSSSPAGSRAAQTRKARTVSGPPERRFVRSRPIAAGGGALDSSPCATPAQRCCSTRAAR
jgi:hypothetical protein